ncbi:hypothetical protein ACT021_17810 [Klebsiella michiganensis]
MTNNQLTDKSQEHGTSEYNDHYYMCRCPECGWFGSSEDIIGGEEICDCPNCHTEVDDLDVGSLWNLVLPKLAELQERRKAERDSEPVATLDVQSRRPDGNKFALVFSSAAHKLPDDVYFLYLHAQPAKTVQPVMFIDGDISTEDADKLAKVIREFNEEDERPLAKMARIIRENPHPTNECDMPKAQPAPVVPDRMTAIVKDEAEYVEGWNACRAAMLQAAPVCTCPSGDGSLRWPCPVHPGNSPVIPEGYVMVPKEPTAQMYDAGDRQMTTKQVWDAMLAAAPQEVNHG